MMSVRTFLLGAALLLSARECSAADLEITAFGGPGTSVSCTVSSGNVINGTYASYNNTSPFVEVGQWVPMPYSPFPYYQYMYHRSTTPRISLQGEGYVVGTPLTVQAYTTVNGYTPVPSYQAWK